MADTEQNFENNDFSQDGQYNNDYSNDQQFTEGGFDENAEAGAGDNQNGTSKPKDDDERKLFIGGLSWDTEEKDLREYFSKYGEIQDVTIKTDPTTGKSRGFGFLTFVTKEALEGALKAAPHTIKGKQIDPKQAKARPGMKKVFVGGLGQDITEEQIKEYFGKYGTVEAIELPFDKTKNQRRNFAFITFDTEEAAKECCKQSKQKVGDRECDIKKATPKPDPRMMMARGGWGAPFPMRGGPPTRGGRGGSRGSGRGSGTSGQGYGGGWGGYGQSYGYGPQSGYGYGYDAYGYGGYDNYGWGNGGYGQGYGEQPSGYGKARRGGQNSGGYHPYSR